MDYRDKQTDSNGNVFEKRPTALSEPADEANWTFAERVIAFVDDRIRNARGKPAA